MPFECTLKTNTIKVGNLDIRYFSVGEGDPLLIIHGGAGGADTWLANAVELSRRYSIYIPDLPGFGLSQAMAGNFDMERYARFIEDFVVSIGLKRFSLMGHSLGGGIAATYAINYPDRVRKLVLVDSVGLGKEISLWARLPCWMFGSIGKTVLKGLRCLVRIFNVEAGSLRALSGFNIDLGNSLMDLKGQTNNLLDSLTRLFVPTLLVWGANDPVVPVTRGYAASQLIPDCKLKVFHGTGHSAHLTRMKEFCQVLVSFLG